MIDANSQFLAILTNVGRAKQANADALGIAWKITEMGVGDGNPNELADPPNPVPSATQTRLLNEWRRKPLNQLRIDPVNTAVIIAEQIIPADEGGKWIREIGLYDADGDLVAVANCAPSFKPLLSQGSGRTQVVRMNFIVSSTGNITLKIDPAVVLATREYVDSRILEELSKLDIKQSVRAATTANINLSGLQTIDGVALVGGDRVLVKNQSLAKNNGPYVVAAGAWSRAKDADNNANLTPNLTVAVESGATQADTIWQLVTDGPIVVGATALTFKDITDGLARLLSPSFAGNPTAPTPVLFDNSKSLATTEYVMRAAGSYRGFTSLTAAASLTTAAAGTVVTTIGTFTVTLPAANVMPMGGAIHFHNIGAGVVNVECVAGDSYNVGGGDHPVSIALQPGATLTVASSPGQAAWWAWGTAQLQYAKVLGYTAPKFDNSKALATTEFVQRALGSYADSVAYQGNTTLTPADVGRLVAIGGTSAYATLPDAAGVPLGSVVTVLASTTVGLTVQARPGQSLVTLSSVAGPFLLAPSTMSVFRRLNDGTGWVLEDGDSALKYSPLFAFNAASGYQKLPSGLILQWGVTGAVAAGTGVTVNYPVLFPNAGITAYAQANGVSPTICYAATVSKLNNAQLGIYNPTSTTGQAISYSWFAIGY
jgi:hypothetical protein